MAVRADQLAAALNSHRSAFKAFLASRVGSEAEAEDILQNGLVKALQHADELQDDAKLTAWFYQLLRHAVIDHYRARGSVHRKHDRLGELVAALGEDVADAPKGWEAQLCGCLGSVVDSLKPAYAALVRRVDLNGESVQAVAGAIGVTPNNASVTLHRARKELRQKLQAFCGACADGACLDCDCTPVPEKRGRVEDRTAGAVSEDESPSFHAPSHQLHHHRRSFVRLRKLPVPPWPALPLRRLQCPAGGGALGFRTGVAPPRRTVEWRAAPARRITPPVMMHCTSLAVTAVLMTFLHHAHP